jgi:hypothetical protein
MPDTHPSKPVDVPTTDRRRAHPRFCACVRTATIYLDLASCMCTSGSRPLPPSAAHPRSLPVTRTRRFPRPQLYHSPPPSESIQFCFECDARRPACPCFELRSVYRIHYIIIIPSISRAGSIHFCLRLSALWALSPLLSLD